MTTQEICERYLRERQGTSTTLAILQDVLRERLSGYRTIWLQAHVAGRASILVTLFNRDGYRMYSCRLANFRHFRPDGNIVGESNRVDWMIDTIIRDAGIPIISP